LGKTIFEKRTTAAHDHEREIKVTSFRTGGKKIRAN